VQVVIADTSPLNYLILIGHIDILPRLFSNVILPSAVGNALADINSPLAVQELDFNGSPVAGSAVRRERNMGNNLNTWTGPGRNGRNPAG
jgi:hypothetical protein